MKQLILMYVAWQDDALDGDGAEWIFASVASGLCGVCYRRKHSAVLLLLH